MFSNGLASDPEQKLIKRCKMQGWTACIALWAKQNFVVEKSVLLLWSPEDPIFKPTVHTRFPIGLCSSWLQWAAVEPIAIYLPCSHRKDHSIAE